MFIGCVFMVRKFLFILVCDRLLSWVFLVVCIVVDVGVLIIGDCLFVFLFFVCLLVYRKFKVFVIIV